MENANTAFRESESRNQLNNWIAVTVALLSSFLAVTKVKDDNVVQAMLQAKTDAVDTWSEYQSKRIKHHLIELGLDQAVALQAGASARGIAQLKDQARSYASEMTRYQAEETGLRNKAKGFEALYDSFNFKDDQFDLSDAALSISLGMLAVTALTAKRWLLGVSWLIAAFGVLMGLAGLLGLRLHPAWLTKLLS